MKQLKNRFLSAWVLALYGFVALLAAAVAPVVARAQSCPPLRVVCNNGKVYYCSGSPQGNTCIYNRSCLNQGNCS
jgi:hypothetical protein